jgi:phytoene dehydrogenase-like protein
VTNYTAKGATRGPLAKVLRQLRFKWEEFALAPQRGSRIAFPGVDLRFSNELALLRSEIHREFPSQVDRFEVLLRQLADYDDLDQDLFVQSARQRLAEIFSDPLLPEMLLCPLMWYGNAREHDMDWGQFGIMFRSIFLEGFARPFKGVRLILKNLVKRYRQLGGEVLLRSAVKQILLDGQTAVGVELEDGRTLLGKRILSSAGHIESLRLCHNTPESRLPAAGQMTFIESISILDCQPEALGHDETIVFYNDQQNFHWHRPESDLCDLRTGVICSPNNYLYDPELGNLPDGVIRLTTIANFDRWNALPEEEYRSEKLRWYDRSIESAIRFVPDFRAHVVDIDVFTPTTIRRFTSHDNGAVYGAPDKQLNGRTPYHNLYLCGTDQGYVGIIGSIMSGISIANLHCLR